MAMAYTRLRSTGMSEHKEKTVHVEQKTRGLQHRLQQRMGSGTELGAVRKGAVAGTVHRCETSDRQPLDLRILPVLRS